MTQKNSSKKMTMFAIGGTASLAAGILCSYISIWVYTSFLKPITLPIGDSILFLGAIATVLYTAIGGAIAYFYLKNLS